MNAKILVTGVAVAVLSAGLAAAQTDQTAPSPSTAATPAPSATASSDMGAKTHVRHHAHHNRMARNERRGAGTYAAPDQPIPYAQLDAYLKASPRERMAMAQQANTGTTADTSATAPAASQGPSTGSSMGAAGSDTPNASTPPQSSMGSSGSDTTSMPPAAAPSTPPNPPQ
jgi:hypothetical protein